MRLKNKVSIITGAAQGIGLATALKFAEEGATVIVCDMKPAGVDAALAMVRARGAQAQGYAVNVTDRAAIDAMGAAVKDQYDHIDHARGNQPSWRAPYQSGEDHLPLPNRS